MVEVKEKCKDCKDLEEAKKQGFCSLDCLYYTPLQGEGEVEIIRRVRVRKKCDNCGAPADYHHAWLYENYCSNPSSSAYHHDDCTWCCDVKTFSCRECENKLSHEPPQGCSRGCSTFPLDKFPHMGLEWKKIELND
jgi:hypothetical protein